MRNRQIKFRAWDNEDNKYFEPIFEAYKGNLLDLSIQLNGSILRRTLEMPAEHDSCFKGRYELEQFTGLTDKNGVDIYEGDIVFFRGTKSDSAQAIVEFKDGRFIFSIDEHFYKDIMGWRDTEVIGNIHQNKDLLK